MTDAPTPPQPALSDAPWPTAVARVNINDPTHPGMRIVGYRVPAVDAGISEALDVLAKRDASIRALQAECEALRDKAVNVIINYAMGWEMDGVMDALSAALDAWSKGTQK